MLDKNFLKNDDDIHSQIVKKSISHILGSEVDKQWYPNLLMKDVPVGYKFKGSPSPKKHLGDELGPSCSPVQGQKMKGVKEDFKIDTFPIKDEEVVRSKLSDFNMMSEPSNSLKKESCNSLSRFQQAISNSEMPEEEDSDDNDSLKGMRD